MTSLARASRGCARPRPDSRHRAINQFLSGRKRAAVDMLRGTFVVRTLCQAEKLATMLASYCPDPQQSSIGIWELLCNAIEHGSYGIDFSEKASLLGEGLYQEELERRARDPRYRDRYVQVWFRKTPKRASPAKARTGGESRSPARCRSRR